MPQSDFVVVKHYIFYATGDSVDFLARHVTCVEIIERIQFENFVFLSGYHQTVSELVINNQLNFSGDSKTTILNSSQKFTPKFSPFYLNRVEEIVRYFVFQVMNVFAKFHAKMDFVIDDFQVHVLSSVPNVDQRMIVSVRGYVVVERNRQFRY